MTGTEAKTRLGEILGSWPSLRPAELSALRARGAQERQDRAHAVVLRVARSQPELGEDAGDVGLDGPDAQEELFRYPEVGPPLRHVPKHLKLALVQGGTHAWLPFPAKQPPHDDRVDDGLALGHPPPALHERVGVGHAIFQQVTDPPPPRLQHARWL